MPQTTSETKISHFRLLPSCSLEFVLLVFQIHAPSALFCDRKLALALGPEKK